MRTRQVALVTVSVVLAAVFVWLGIWQVGRLHEKQAYNAMVAARRFLPAIPYDSLPDDTSAAKLRRVRLQGRLDYDNEIVWTIRGRNGSPGVNILTPLVRSGRDTVVLVNRGWVYSPDATTVDSRKWREGDSVVAEGYVLPMQSTGKISGVAARTRTYRVLDAKTLSSELRRPVARMLIILGNPPSDSLHTPPRVTLVPLDEASHRSYAYQWFSFAAISIFGAGIFIRKT